MKRHDDTLQAALDGYAGAPYDYTKHGMHTSTNHAAFCLGQHLQATGRTAPRAVRRGRGDLMHCNDMLFRLNWANVRHPTITRES